MKIELHVSDENEATEAPYWLIIDPYKMDRTKSVHSIASAIFGPFFSRETAEKELDCNPHRYSAKARVYCHSGYSSAEYTAACKKARLLAKGE